MVETGRALSLHRSLKMLNKQVFNIFFKCFNKNFFISFFLRNFAL